jgi:hypothetical protein
MAVGTRAAGVLPLAGASLAAVALAGIAVFSVTKADCTEPGQYVRHADGQLELIGSCVDPATLPDKYKSDEDQVQPPPVGDLNELFKPHTQAP